MATTQTTRATSRCAECDARLAHDQRYCLECGARRGPLPSHVSHLIGAIFEQGPRTQAAALPPAARVSDPSETRRFGFEMPGPRAAAVAVMATLAFGIVVGSIAGGTSVATLASAPLVVVGLNPPATSAPASHNVTVTESGPSDAGASLAPTASPATVQASAPPSGSATPASTSGSGTSTTSTGFGGLPPVKHVFLIALSDRGFNQSFGAGATSGYLGGALRRQGELVQNYYAVAGAPLANEIALISGQGPTPQTATDCPVFSRVKPGSKGRRGQILGTGCAYPPATRTLAGQLTTDRHTWKAYLAGVGSGARTACRVPRFGSRQPQLAGRTSYLAWRNPFLYFRSLTAGTACRQSEVGIGQLAADVKSASTAPSLAYIIPPPCAAGGEAPCRTGAPTNLAATNRFLKSVVPEIKRSAAYKDGGLIAITFDQAPQTGADADPSACCNSPTTYPNLHRLATPPAVPPAAMGVGTSTTTATTAPPVTVPVTGTDTSTATTTTSTTTDTAGTDTTTTATTTATTPAATTPATSLGDGETTPTGGGGQVGLLLISPYVKPDSIDVVDYFNHFSLLASIENLFGLHRLGYAGIPGLPVFGLGVYNAYGG
jgi:phosphatidylinositol-3-phosphatase